MTSRCNLACAWCRRKKIGPPKTPDMTVRTVAALVDQYPELNIFAMAGQGEPTLCRDFAPVVRFLAGRGATLILDTNGVNSAGLEDLSGCFTRISLSLYGHDRASFQAYTGLDGFEKVLASWAKYKTIAAETAITYIMDKDDLDSLARVLDLCDRLEPAEVLLYNPLCYDPADAAQKAKVIACGDGAVIERIRELAQGRAYSVVLPPFPDFAKPQNLCRSYRGVINLDGNGDIGGCLRKIPPGAEFGNVFRDADCYNTKSMAKIRRLQMIGRPAHPQCADCFGSYGHGESFAARPRTQGRD